MLFDSKQLTKKQELSIPDDYISIGPDVYAWCDGYCFVNDKPLTGRAMLETVYEILKGDNVSHQLSMLNGSFSIVYLAHNQIDIVSDRLGTRPLYYAPVDNQFVLGTDFWGIVDAIGSPMLSMHSAIELLTFNYVLAENTLVEQIKEVPSATWMRFTLGGPTCLPVNEEATRYWIYDICPEYVNHNDMIAQLADILNDVGHRYANLLSISQVNRIGLNLTSGLDSRLIAYMLHSNDVKFHCFTSREMGNENDAAFKVAKNLEVPHSFVPSWQNKVSQPDENVFWALAPTTMCTVSNHPINLATFGPWPVDGFISGHMGDRVSGRHATLRAYWAARKGRSKLLDFLVQKHTCLKPLDLTNILSCQAKDDAYAGVTSLSQRYEKARVSHEFNLVSRMDFEQRQRRFILRDYLSLRQLGVSVMPLIDYKIFDYFSKVPFEWQIGGMAYISAICKHLFVGRYEELAALPINNHRKTAIQHPILENYMSSAWDLGKNHLNKAILRIPLVGRCKQRTTTSTNINSETTAEFMNSLSSLDWLCDIEYIKRAIENTQPSCRFTPSTFWSLYTLSRVSARIRGHA